MMNNSNIAAMITGLLMAGLSLAGCAATNPGVSEVRQLQPSLTTISQIDSFSPATASQQALEVVRNNPYDQDFFTRAFARLVEQCRNSKAPENAGIIWDNFVTPLKSSGKVPPDLATTTWNSYFSRQFASLPAVAAVSDYCQKLPAIKGDIAKEYELKKAGFEVTGQGSADTHFLNAMYVYNTMWAACRPQE